MTDDATADLAPDLHVPARGILFDNDGVLVDSLAAVESAWSRWAHAHDLEPAEALSVVHGRRAADTVAALLPADRRAAGVDMIDTLEIEDAGMVAAMAGVPALLAMLPPGSWAVVTSGTRLLATARLQAAGIPVPEVFVTADDVAVGKPDPAGYLKCIDLLGQQLGEKLTPTDCVVFEDAPRVIDRLKPLGFYCVGVAGHIPESRFEGAAAIITGLSPEQIKAKLPQLDLYEELKL